MKKQNFSLIELLIVVAMMAILAGIAIPAINKVREKAKITRVKSDINAIKMALKQAENTYSNFSKIIDNYADDKGLISGNNYTTLINELSNPTAVSDIKFNTRKIIFLDYRKPKGGASTGWQDPWITPTSNNDYVIYIDTNYDGKVKINGKDGKDDPSIGQDVVADSVAVYSKGPNNIDDHGLNDQHIPENTNKDDIASW